MTPGTGPRRSTVRIAPYRIHAIELGEGKESLVLIHGLSGSSRWWQRNIHAFAKQYRVLAPDVIGFGRTRCPGELPGIAETAALLADWMAEMGAGRAHLVGHSMGGHICAHLAARYPERVHRLVLADAAGIPRPLHPGTLVRLALDVAPPGRWGDPLFLPVIARDVLTAGPGTILRAVNHILRDDVRPLLPHIRAPTLVVWGERDALIPLSDAREFRRHIPDARLAVLPAAGHNAMVDRPAAFNRVVLRFLNGEDVGR